MLGIFSAAPRHVLERLAGAATEIDAPAGEVVIQEGEPADALFVIPSGEVSVSARTPAGAPRFVTAIRGPAYFGEIGLLEGIPRTATVETLEPTRLWRIDGAEFLDALNDAPATSVFLETALVRRSRTQGITADPDSAAPAGVG